MKLCHEKKFTEVLVSMDKFCYYLPNDISTSRGRRKTIQIPLNVSCNNTYFLYGGHGLIFNIRDAVCNIVI